MKKLQPVVFIALSGLLMLLSGCQTIRSHNPFRHREPDYKSAQQEQPLEVPPGIDNPPESEALTIPGAGNPSTVGAAGSTNLSAPAYPVVTGNGMTLADDPASAYRRVGLALERGGVGTLSGRDDNAHTYQVAVNSVATVESKGGFLHRMFHHSHSETVTGTVNVVITAQGSGSLVSLSGDPEAVERVLAMLRQRLAGG